MADALAIRPGTSGVVFSPKQILKTSPSPTPSRPRSQASWKNDGNGQYSPNRRSVAVSSTSVSAYAANPNLSIIEIEQIFRERIQQSYHDLKLMCQNYDIDQSLCITKGELRRVLESTVMPLTSEQFEAVLAKVPLNPNGTINYCLFLDRFSGKPANSREAAWMSSGHRYNYTKSPRQMGMDHMERMLKERIGNNLKNIIKAFRLFDYNRDGKIQRHEMRKVLENYCFRMTDSQFDRIWAHYDYNHSGLVNYYDFLRRLGVNVKNYEKAGKEETTKLAMNWQQHQQMEKIKQVEQQALINRGDSIVKGLNSDNFEKELRRRLKENYSNLKKAFMAFDVKRDGYIALEDLKSILANFTLPMSDQLFSQLMGRFGFKATGKIPWEHFLAKFQDPQNEGNGQTIPIKNSHKVNPIRETESEMNIDDILRLLHKHVINMYPSLKQAFLVFDEKRTGKITKNDFRRILDSLTFDMNDTQFNLLMQRLDPDKINHIDYHTFLNMFEARESEDGHKWLNSEHRFNQEKKPAVLAWNTIEDLLREKLVEFWKNVSQAFLAVDPKKTGLVARNSLKSILDKHVLPTTDQHFDKLFGQCNQTPDGLIYFAEFLEKLGVDVSPGDLYGTSTQIHVLSELAESQRQADLNKRLSSIQKNALDRTNQMAFGEVITKLKDRMSQHNTKIRQTFLQFSKKSSSGKLKKREFRQMLESFGMYMADDQFNKLSELLGFDEGPLTYSDFVINFEDLRHGGPGAEILHRPNHRFNQLGMETMSALEAEAHFRDKLREGFSDLRNAFYKLDDDHDGLITKEDFRNLMDSFMFNMNDEEFEKFMQKMDMGNRTKLNYRAFLDKFEARDTPNGHKWLDSEHRYNRTKTPNEMAADQVHEILKAKAHTKYGDLSKAFRSIDQSGRGIIKKKELRQLLYKFMLPITKDEFEKLWEKYDPNQQGHIDHSHFLNLLGLTFAPGDDKGESRRIWENSYKELDSHHEKQVEKHNVISLNQIQKANYIKVDELQQQLKDRFRDHYSSLYTAFKQADLNKEGKLSIADIQKILVDHSYLVDDNTFSLLLDRIGLVSNKSKLSYDQFLQAFDEGQASKFRKPSQPEITVESFSSLAPDKAVKKLRRIVMSDYESLEAAFNTFDREHTGKVSPAEFRRVLDFFCFKLNDKQFKHLTTKLSMNSDLTINWPQFLNDFKVEESEVVQSWFDSVQKVQDKENSPKSISGEELEMQLRQLVSAHMYKFVERLTDKDYAGIGVISREDFRDILNDLSLRLRTDQFEELWSRLDINEFGNLDYKKFLKRFSNEGIEELLSPILGLTTPQPHPSHSRPATTTPRQASRLSASRLSVPDSYQYGRRAITPMVNAEDIEKKMRDNICKNWKGIQKICRSKDSENTGDIDVYDFKDIMEHFNIYLPSDEFRQLIMKYDLKDNGKFCYMNFLRNFVLRLRPISEDAEPSNEKLMQRKIIHKAKRPMTPGTKSDDLMDSMIRVRNCVVQNWKDMRRIFRGIDTNAQGYVTPMQFRNILRQFSINLSEDEFFHVMSYYNKDLSGKISYNDFLRAYLQS